MHRSERGSWAVLLTAAVVAVALTLATSSQSATDGQAPTPCSSTEVGALVDRFLHAYGAGDRGRLDRLFAREPGFVWYAVQGPHGRTGAAASDRSTLLRYFAARHTEGERLTLRVFRFNGNSLGAVGSTYGNFEYRLVRTARDASATRYEGKGAARCFPGADADVISVWSMGHR